jgi:hypothetical protein
LDRQSPSLQVAGQISTAAALQDGDDMAGSTMKSRLSVKLLPCRTTMTSKAMACKVMQASSLRLLATR